MVFHCFLFSKKIWIVWKITLWEKRTDHFDYFAYSPNGETFQGTPGCRGWSRRTVRQNAWEESSQLEAGGNCQPGFAGKTHTAFKVWINHLDYVFLIYDVFMVCNVFYVRKICFCNTNHQGRKCYRSTSRSLHLCFWFIQSIPCFRICLQCSINVREKRFNIQINVRLYDLLGEDKNLIQCR